MAVYKSGYTGSEIDEAVKSVRTGGVVNRIDNLSSRVDQINTNLNTETTERKAQDTTLQTNIDKKANTTDLDTLKSTVNNNWSLLMANLGIGRWRNIPLVWFEGQQAYLYDNLFPYFTSLDCYGLGCYPSSSNTTMKINLVPNSKLKSNNFFMAYAGNTDGTSSLIIESNLNFTSSAVAFGYNYFKSITGSTRLFKSNTSQYRPFYNCSYLEEIGEFDMENVELPGGSFASYSKNLKKISCKNWTSSILQFSQWTLPAATVDTFVEIFSNLKDMTSSSTTHTIVVSSKVSLTDEQIKVATDKGWVVTRG